MQLWEYIQWMLNAGYRVTFQTKSDGKIECMAERYGRDELGTAGSVRGAAFKCYKKVIK